MPATVHAMRMQTPAIQRQLEAGENGMLLKTECQQEWKLAIQLLSDHSSAVLFDYISRHLGRR